MCKRSCSRVTAQPYTGISHCCVRRRRVRVYCLPLPLTLDPLWYAGLTVGGWGGVAPAIVEVEVVVVVWTKRKGCGGLLVPG